jgi:hypothetical protein
MTSSCESLQTSIDGKVTAQAPKRAPSPVMSCNESGEH